MAKRIRIKNRTTSANLAAQAFKQDAGDISFQEEPTKDGKTFNDFIITLYGPPKIGKSTLAMTFNDVYLLPTEPGYHQFKVRKTKIINWKSFISFIELVERQPKKLETVSMFVIDTVDNLAKFCMQYTCGRDGIAHPSDEEWGKGWESFRDEFNHWVLRLASLNCGVLFIAHDQDREIISRGLKITKATPSLPKTAYTIVNNLSDIILYMSYSRERKKKGSKAELVRCLYTKPSESRDAGDRTATLPSVIRFKTEEQAINTILSAYK